MTSTGHESEAAGPTLYLESSELDPTESFCTDVFENAADGEYRVVQVTATQSFESVRDALNTQLEQINDPSEAAVIITTPQAEKEATRGQVGEDTPLYGFRVSPDDLTGISIAFSQLIEKWEAEDAPVKICLRDIESLLPYHDAELVYRFLNTVLATLQGAGADVHAHFRSGATDDQSLQLFRSLFDTVVDHEASPLQSVAETEPDAEQAPSTASGEATLSGDDEDAADKETAPEPDSVSSGEMSNEEIDTFLSGEGYGTLAFGGDKPYAIPMSYGYDDSERVLYMHMGLFEGSEKASRIRDQTPASLVVTRYERPDKWRSVVVEGTVSKLSRDEVREREVVTAFAKSELASVDIFVPDLSEVDFEWYMLDPETLSGRRSVGSMAGAER
ncbi:FMN-binding domain protein [Natronomonas pharaonis DSM 2160]|uniref:FMN-binding domain protein n=1 Tax=Natronomonas pharaonis (strain ATCC 35678 / DSM 2160 / CIP 103997 / JCM 8858 / NBRC 14720 / NCIMB 2260 / Gabara) TaxID=348780 RepID=A0A1U7EYW9_NATPD|nr:pyridoxamine 5'-phosphate oxidase family protein [Natronomonas pharaonis]CAI50452.1 FMN-binding domain protein [Natronomonas pharaonis DSM 2160]